MLHGDKPRLERVWWPKTCNTHDPGFITDDVSKSHHLVFQDTRCGDIRQEVQSIYCTIAKLKLESLYTSHAQPVGCGPAVSLRFILKIIGGSSVTRCMMGWNVQHLQIIATHKLKGELEHVCCWKLCVCMLIRAHSVMVSLFQWRVSPLKHLITPNCHKNRWRTRHAQSMWVWEVGKLLHFQKKSNVFSI